MDGKFWKWKLKVSLVHFSQSPASHINRFYSKSMVIMPGSILVTARDNLAHDHAMTSESAQDARDYQSHNNKSMRIQQRSTLEVDSRKKSNLFSTASTAIATNS